MIKNYYDYLFIIKISFGWQYQQDLINANIVIIPIVNLYIYLLIDLLIYLFIGVILYQFSLNLLKKS